jgi:hypothetical protein
MEGPVSDILTVTVHRPLRLDAIERYARKAAESGEEINVADVRALLAVTVACRSVTRREAHVRGNLREATFEWIEKQTGKKRLDIDQDQLPDGLSAEFVTRMHACDIIAALAWGECEGFEFGRPVPEWIDDMEFWQATDNPKDWPECKDWLFSRALGCAWEANPHWSLAAGNIPFD